MQNQDVEDPGCTMNKCIQCSKDTCSCLFSHIGLSGLVISYTIMGGFLFCVIEVETEKITKQQMMKLRNSTENKLMDLIGNSWHQENTTLQLVQDILTNHEKALLDMTFEKGWNGRYPENDLNWSYAGSLLYSVTVITTIGYGHVTPKTITGRIVTIFYAVFGIPLTILYLNNIGDFLAELFQFLYLHMCLPLFRRMSKKSQTLPLHIPHHPNQQPKIVASYSVDKKNRNGSKSPVSNAPSIKIHTNSLQPHINYPPTNIYGKSMGRDVSITPTPPPPSFTHLIKAPPGQMVVIGGRSQSVGSDQSYDCPTPYDTPYSNNELKHSNTVPIISMIEHTKVNDWSDLEKLHHQLEQAEETNLDAHHCRDEDNVSRISHSFRRNAIHPESHYPPPKMWKSVGNYPDHHYHLHTHEENNMRAMVPDEADEDNEEIESVPLTLTLTIMVVYILMGAFLFTLWSKDKNLIHLVKWSYFCFITLSTIGFGDIVPGTTIDDENPKEKIIVSLLYVAIGLPVFAMCFKLMQDEIIKKVKNLARKVGVIKS